MSEEEVAEYTDKDIREFYEQVLEEDYYSNDQCHICAGWKMSCHCLGSYPYGAAMKKRIWKVVLGIDL